MGEVIEFPRNVVQDEPWSCELHDWSCELHDWSCEVDDFHAPPVEALVFDVTDKSASMVRISATVPRDFTIKVMMAWNRVFENSGIAYPPVAAE